MDNEIEKVFNQVKTVKTVNTKEMVSVVANVMETTEKLVNADGKEKKNVVETVIELLINDSENELLKDTFSSEVVGSLIEVIISATKGKYKLQSKWKKFKNCCKK